MKIRTQFVSNSSSASYIITIKNITLDDFSTWYLESDFRYIYDKHRILTELNKRILEAQETIKLRENEEPPKDEFLIHLNKVYDQILQNLIDIEKKLNEATEPIEWIPIVFEYYDIFINLKANNISLFHNTTMHNSYEDVPAILQQIILENNFTKKLDIVCEVEHG